MIWCKIQHVVASLDSLSLFLSVYSCICVCGASHSLRDKRLFSLPHMHAPSCSCFSQPFHVPMHIGPGAPPVPTQQVIYLLCGNTLAPVCVCVGVCGCVCVLCVGTTCSHTTGKLPVVWEQVVPRTLGSINNSTTTVMQELGLPSKWLGFKIFGGHILLPSFSSRFTLFHSEKLLGQG